MSASPDPVLEHVWSRLQPLLIGKRDQFFAAMARHDLTPPHGQALTMLAEGPLRMRDIADLMICDASYVTAIVDNLEHRGLAERRTSAGDRRVKEIALTAKGKAAAAELHAQMISPPPVLEALSPADRKALAKILDKLDLDETEPLWPKAAWRVGKH
ncbi:MAG: Transcriptional regulator, MarR family [Ilumatobacteraceae bacterium]|nr:Transcriptional regulator, MarR family [Ilumatobacteraceae bacterium]